MKTYLMGAAAALLIPWAAQAADLGGNCCADLEERVAELEATTARKGNRKLSLTVSGHVNQALFTTDIDANNLDKVRIMDNTNSESRFRFTGEVKASSEWSAGFLMEFGLGGYELDVRHQAVYLKLKSLGTVWLGKTSEATDGITEISLAPSDASTLTSLAPLDGVIASETGLGVVNPFDGGRTETVTFISESLSGFQVRGSWNGGNDFSAALRYAGEFGPMRVAAGIGYRKEDVNVGPLAVKAGDRDFWGGSGSIMHVPTGLFIDGAYGNSDGLQTFELASVPFPIGDTRVELYAGRAGFSRNMQGMGKTTIYGEYGQLKITDFDADPRFWGLGISQDIGGAAATIYGSWRMYDLDLGEDDDANVFLAGVKVRF